MRDVSGERETSDSRGSGGSGGRGFKIENILNEADGGAIEDAGDAAAGQFRPFLSIYFIHKL